MSTTSLKGITAKDSASTFVISVHKSTTVIRTYVFYGGILT
jgi:hypothetical protein